MKHRTTLALALLAASLATACRSSFPASTENAYQASVKAVQNAMTADGYALSGRNTQGGYHDKETYLFRNTNNDEVEFTIQLHRGQHLGNTFINEVSVEGCRTSAPKDFDRYCGTNGKPAATLKKTLKKDTTGSEFSPGKTIAISLAGVFTLGIILAVLQEKALNASL